MEERRDCLFTGSKMIWRVPGLQRLLKGSPQVTSVLDSPWKYQSIKRFYGPVGPHPCGPRAYCNGQVYVEVLQAIHPTLARHVDCTVLLASLNP
jgi:hypothetical protein